MKLFFQNRYVKNIMSMAGGAAIAQLCFVAATPVLTRLYLPSSYGNFANLMALSAIYSPIASLRYDFLFFKEKNHLNQYFTTSLISLAITLPFFYLIYVLSYPGLFSLTDKILLLTASCTAGLLNLTSQFLIGSLEYGGFSKTKALQGIIQVIFSLIFGFAGLSSGLILALVISQTVTTWYQYKLLNNRAAISVNFNNGFKLFISNIKVALTSTVTTLLQYSTPIAPIFISMMYYSKTDSGIYFFCAQLFSVPLSLFRRALLNIITSEFSDKKLAYTNFISLINKTKKIQIAFIGISALIILSIYYEGEWIFKILFGKEWNNAGRLAWIILFMFLVDMICQPISNMMTLWNEERKNLAVEFVRFCSVFILPITLINMVSLKFDEYVFVHCTSMISVYILSSFITIRSLLNHDK